MLILATIGCLKVVPAPGSDEHAVLFSASLGPVHSTNADTLQGWRDSIPTRFVMQEGQKSRGIEDYAHAFRDSCAASGPPFGNQLLRQPHIPRPVPKPLAQSLLHGLPSLQYQTLTDRSGDRSGPADAVLSASAAGCIPPVEGF